MPVVGLITGPMAAGKSTTARALAERFDRGVHLEGDVFRRSIVSGRREMTPEPTPAALEELHASFVESTPRIGTWLDTTHLTPAETVDRIMAIVGRP